MYAATSKSIKIGTSLIFKVRQCLVTKMRQQTVNSSGVCLLSLFLWQQNYIGFEEKMEQGLLIITGLWPAAQSLSACRAWKSNRQSHNSPRAMMVTFQDTLVTNTTVVSSLRSASVTHLTLIPDFHCKQSVNESTQELLTSSTCTSVWEKGKHVQQGKTFFFYS